MNANRGALIALMVLVLCTFVPLTYVGSYLALADNSGRLEMRQDGCCYQRQYYYGGATAEYVFWPARFVDLQLRPVHWGVVDHQP